MSGGSLTEPESDVNLLPKGRKKSEKRKHHYQKV